MNKEHSVRDELLQAALTARRHAYAPYSHFAVGAAILTAEGKTFVGCNVENASFGLTICAERAAVAAAVSAGSVQWERIAIAAAGGVSPCGACCQVLAEFHPELPILMVDTDRNNAVVEVSLVDLFPQPFRRCENQ